MGARTLALALLITWRGSIADRDEEHPLTSAAEIAGVEFKAMLRAAFEGAGNESAEIEGA